MAIDLEIVVKRAQHAIDSVQIFDDWYICVRLQMRFLSVQMLEY